MRGLGNNLELRIVVEIFFQIELQDELIDRFGEYPDVVAYLLEIGLAKAYLDKVFVNRVERRNNKLVIQFLRDRQLHLDTHQNGQLTHLVILRN